MINEKTRQKEIHRIGNKLPVGFGISGFWNFKNQKNGVVFTNSYQIGIPRKSVRFSLTLYWHSLYKDEFDCGHLRSGHLKICFHKDDKYYAKRYCVREILSKRFWDFLDELRKEYVMNRSK